MFSVLVVEDDETLNKMICAKLKQEYFQTFPAFDGEEALQILDKEYIDLIICDIMMPKMDGYILTRELRSSAYKLPILMITAKGQMNGLLLVSIPSLCIACVFSFLLVLAGIKLLYHGPFTLPVAVVMGFLICCLSISIGGTMLWLISSRFTKPIEEVSKAVKKVANGDFTVCIDKKTSHFAGYELTNETDELAQNFNTMTAELNSMDYMRKDFMSNVSHELKTPVAAITGFTEILMDGSLSLEDQKEYLMLVNKESLRLSRLCESMLRMSRLDHQQIVRKEDKVRVDEQIRKCIIMLSEKWADKTRDYELDLAQLEIQSDADLLTQVWSNLIDNAIKYSPENSTISICGKIEKDTLIVNIQDEGNGIDKKDKFKIFEKFYQCDESHKKNGSGLGLSIVKRIIDLLGGTITCISEKGEGTIMEVKIPV